MGGRSFADPRLLYYTATQEVDEMPELIRENRRRLGLSIYDLAHRLGVTAGTVSRMEDSERSGTIKMATLRRALQAMGQSVDVITRPVPREELVALNLHHALAEKLRHVPAATLSVVPGNLERMRAAVHGNRAHGWLDEWAELVRRPIPELIDAMLAPTPHGNDLRQNSPFAGALSQDERLEAIQRSNTMTDAS